MKTHISPKQAREVSEETFYSVFNELVPRKDWATYHHKKMDIGRMIDYLDEVKITKSVMNDMWDVFCFKQHYKEKELVDALWEAMKDPRLHAPLLKVKEMRTDLTKLKN